MKKFLASLMIFLLCATPAFAFLYDEVKWKTPEEISKLSEADLYELYVETRIVDKASQEFHISAGYSNAKDYNLRRKLLRFIFDLRAEMSRREGLDPAKIDENMK